MLKLELGPAAFLTLLSIIASNTAESLLSKPSQVIPLLD
jgi:hypothetical protein